jgi:hypothetical protein
VSRDVLSRGARAAVPDSVSAVCQAERLTA